MAEVRTVQGKQWPRISYVPRRSSIAAKKIKPIIHEEALPSTTNTNESISTQPLGSPDQKLPQIESIILPPRFSTTDASDAFKTNRISTVSTTKFSSSVDDHLISPTQKTEESHSFCQWFSRLTPKQKTLFKIAIVTLVLLLGAAAAIIPPVYLLVNRQSRIESSATNITASVCSSTTCIGKETPFRTSIVTVLYPFDGNVNDLSGYATGTLSGIPASTISSVAYVGTASLGLNPTFLQYVQIPYINLAQQSFTIQAWIYPTTSSTLVDYGIFCQCDSSSKCISISLRNARFTLSFDSMNTNNTLSGATVTVVQDWVHLTVVYDAVLFQQQIYVNGRIDAISRGMVASFKGTSSGSVTTIGKTLSSAYGSSYFSGRIDHFTISAGVARTACQIYNDATLSVYYPFDTVAPFNDYSVNLFNGIVSSMTTISVGRLGQAIYFPSNTSYLEAQCFPSLDVNDQPYSFSLWVNSGAVGGGGSLVHLSAWQNGSGTPCYDLLSFTATGALVAQWIISSVAVNGTLGPILPTNTWTHVAVVYGQANGLRLFINGQLSATSQNVGILAVYDYSSPMYVTLGNNGPYNPVLSPSCPASSLPVVPGWFMGAIDEFRIYDRELDNQEICVLANL